MFTAMENNITYEIDLIGGAKNPSGPPHRHVVFGKRVTAKRLFEISSNSMSSIRTQYDDLELIEMITEFGTLKMPVPLTTLLDLDTIDRDDLKEAGNLFAAKTLGERKYSFSDDKKNVTLVFGLKVNELRYTNVEFGRRLTGRDEVDGDKRNLSGLRRRAFLAGRQISKITTGDGESEIEGPVEFETFDSDDCDGDDLFAVISASELWRQSFRLSGGTVREIGTAPESSDSGA